LLLHGVTLYGLRLRNNMCLLLQCRYCYLNTLYAWWVLLLLCLYLPVHIHYLLYAIGSFLLLLLPILRSGSANVWLRCALPCTADIHIHLPVLLPYSFSLVGTTFVYAVLPSCTCFGALLFSFFTLDAIHLPTFSVCLYMPCYTYLPSSVSLIGCFLPVPSRVELCLLPHTIPLHLPSFIPMPYLPSCSADAPGIRTMTSYPSSLF
jgi:hypothetical protein